MTKKKVGLLFGGRSGEHEVSLVSAGTIAEHLSKELFEVVPIFIARSGRWYAPVPMDQITTANEEALQDREVILAPRPGGILLSAQTGKEVCRLDVVFPIVHGTYGEDGVTQGLLELAGVPYVGSGVAGSAVNMDKGIMRKILAYHNIPQVDFTLVKRYDFEERQEETLKDVEAKLAYPVFVKPANGGSSVGISKAHDRDELIHALTEAAKYDSKLLIEQGLTIREIETAVLGNVHPKASMPGEISASNEFYDYKAKYIDNKSVAQIPADLTEEQTKAVQKLALDAYEALDCEGFARVDCFLEPSTGKLYLNEINTLPGFTEISMYPKMWEAGGLSITDLLTRLVELAEERFHDRSRNSISCD